MKKLLFYAIALLSVATALSGCKKDEVVDLVPSISVTQPEAYPSEGGTYTLSCNIENALEGMALEASSRDEWITNIVVDGANVSFNLTMNNSPKERNGGIILKYQDADEVRIKVKQESGENSYTAISESSTANCYIVSTTGKFTFPLVKGNSTESVGEVSSMEILWKSFGTDVVPESGDLITEVYCKDDLAYFVTGAEFKKGNTVIAAKDKDGKILWSWHLWMTEQPIEQVYNENAGTMMDRNLGATSVTPGDVGILGLLYQWGRKDPFLNSSSFTEAIMAKSTLKTWPSPLEYLNTIGSIQYAIENPTKFMCASNGIGLDWCYSPQQIDKTRWGAKKTIYDPCPPGYKIPGIGVWNIALGKEAWIQDHNIEQTDNCMNFGATNGSVWQLTEDDYCWYPIAFSIDFATGNVINKDNGGYYWSYTDFGSYGETVDTFHFDETSINYAVGYFRSYGLSVRCQKE